MNNLVLCYSDCDLAVGENSLGIIKKCGFELLVSYDKEEAMELIHSKKPFLVILLTSGSNALDIMSSDTNDKDTKYLVACDSEGIDEVLLFRFNSNKPIYSCIGVNSPDFGFFLDKILNGEIGQKNSKVLAFGNLKYSDTYGAMS